MFKISKEDMDFIKDNIPDAENIMNLTNKNDNLNILLRAIDDQIIYQGFDDSYALNDFGLIAQEVHDRIFSEN